MRVNNRHCRAQTARTRIAGHEVVLAKPETYMNLSGASVSELVREYEAQPEQDLVLLYDELDLPFGSLRVRPRGRSAGHNGVESVIGALGTQEITRIRHGSWARSSGGRRRAVCAVASSRRRSWRW